MCVDVPKLSLDRPFTYLIPDDVEAGIGSLVSVPFHGRNLRGWILGPAEALPAKIGAIRKVLGPVRFFDPSMLALLRWVSERYLSPLATVIDRSHPPRVVSEEAVFGAGFPPASRVGRSAGPPRASAPPPAQPPPYARGVLTWHRPLPGDEAVDCVRAVEGTVASGRTAIVLVPEAEPVPYTASAVLERFGDTAVSFLGGDARERYRTWLDIQAGSYQIVVATRPGIFAPLHRLGLIWISREVHPGHREDRAPYYHVRDVAEARARLEGLASVVASFAPSVATVDRIQRHEGAVVRPPRAVERARAPLVETVAPEAEDRSTRLAQLLKRARSVALVVSRAGYGVARVCRSCGHPAACARCGGPIVKERNAVACATCGSPGRCANCGSDTFGIERTGAERIAEWAARMAAVPVVLDVSGATVDLGPGRAVVGTAATVKDIGPRELDLVAVLDPDRALVRSGMHAGEQALATWMEAAAWARPRAKGGRVLAQTRSPGHPALQALIRWDPVPFLREEGESRARAGFPPGYPTFRIEGTTSLPDELSAVRTETLLTSPRGDGTVCLVAVRPSDLGALRESVYRLAAAGVVTRVVADPHV